MEVKSSFSDRGVEFCMKFYNYLADHSSTDANLIFSPLCTEVALSLAYLGARGITREELAGVLQFHGDQPLESLHQTLMRLKQNEETFNPSLYSPIINYKLFTATGLFLDQEYPFKESFLDDAKRLFGAQCHNVQFATEPDAAVAAINQFVTKQTNGTIDDLLTSSELSPATKLISVNALYFKANWHLQFEDSKTVKKPFTTASGDKVLVDTMHATIECKYFKSKELGGAKFLRLPYVEECTHAYFILPGKKKRFSKWSPGLALHNLYRSLTPATLQTAFRSLQEITYGTIQLPKFIIRHSIDMEDMLKDFGVKTAFDDNQADFTGISDGRLSIDQIKQKVFIDVNEKGTEASAAIQVTYVDACLPPDTRAKFIADRPFIFLLRHEASDTILFVGHVADPSAQ
ncbi:serpin B6-like [Paramacrobiotus metropolitanus]|uniref:serpin B6-like n=1 Tax=Paramacrobiotus metropolitanus TaxID=2943436 RepID=UPI0024456A19|nr:serpin B6-like [Paramacrobiotus metropolitanus]XP_055335005.1 serpin B6-like [Paramacrobiotus metropolitanus]